jgi:hypothetical protein
LTSATPPDFDSLDEGSADIESFTSNKLDVMDAISMDPRVSHGEFRVAFRLLQHANAKTGRIFPSQERIANQIGVKVRQVREYIAGLVEKGWLRATRPNRQLPNQYAFDLKHVNAILDRQISLQDALSEERAERRNATSQKSLRGEKSPLARGRILPVPRGRIPPLNTLSEPLTITPEESGMGIERDIVEMRETG